MTLSHNFIFILLSLVFTDYSALVYPFISSEKFESRLKRKVWFSIQYLKMLFHFLCRVMDIRHGMETMAQKLWPNAWQGRVCTLAAGVFGVIVIKKILKVVKTRRLRWVKTYN